MQKRIRVLVLVCVIVLALFLMGIVSFFYIKKQNNLPVKTPVVTSTKSLKLVQGLESKGFILESNPVELNGAIIASISGTKVVFSAKKSIETQVKALQLITTSFKIDESKPREIDLRFDKVVLRY